MNFVPHRIGACLAVGVLSFGIPAAALADPLPPGGTVVQVPDPAVGTLPGEQGRDIFTDPPVTTSIPPVTNAGKSTSKKVTTTIAASDTNIDASSGTAPLTSDTAEEIAISSTVAPDAQPVSVLGEVVERDNEAATDESNGFPVELGLAVAAIAGAIGFFAYKSRR